MKKKQLWKAFGTGALALSMLVSPAAAVSAQADVVSSSAITSGSALGLDPTQEAVGTEDEEGYVPAYSDTQIPVWGFTENTTVYSADIEWGAMTFRYENSSWDPETHTEVAGKGWQVYDSTEEKALTETETVINEIKVTNHSNAPVYATLAYASETAYSDTTGGFSFRTGTADGDTNVLTGASGSVPAYLTLSTAQNNLGDAEGEGKATVGKAYFMPDGINTTDGAVNSIEKWTKIGTITVSIQTAQPTAPATENP